MFFQLCLNALTSATLELDAAYKLLADANNQIVGAHFLSDHASGLINTIKQAMLNQTTVDDLYRQTILNPYPTGESDLSYMQKPILSDS